MTVHVPHPYLAKLERVLDRMGGLYTVSDILEATAARRMQSFVEGESIAITRVAIYPRAKAVEVLAVVGNIDDARVLHDRVLAFAANEGASVVLAYGRPGWADDARRRGWKVKAKKLRLPTGHQPMSGGSTTNDTTTNQVNQIPQWMSDAGQQNYAYAQNVAQQPLQQYQGQMVADVSPQMQQSWDVAANSGNVGSDQFNAATAGYLGALGQTPTTVNAATYNAAQTGGSDLSQYMNPYTQSVINATLPLMQQQNALAQNQVANQANSANAFGGSRQGIQQGVAQAQGALNIGQMASTLNQANYNQRGRRVSSTSGRKIPHLSSTRSAEHTANQRPRPRTRSTPTSSRRRG